MARCIIPACYALALLLLVGSLTGCSTPGCRAKQQSAAFGKLAPVDQRLVLRGRIRQGLSQEAVYIAWGKPDRKTQGGKGRESVERWVYFSQITNYAPMSSYDQRYPGVAELYAPNYSSWSHPGFGYGGSGGAGLLYPSRVLLTEVRRKQVDFTGGKVSAYETRRGGVALSPAAP